MKRAQGKSNLAIVRDYLSGERPFVQVGYDSSIANLSRKENEEWEDSSGAKWVMKGGYKKRVGKEAVRINEQRCTICNADMKWGNYLDERIYPKTRRCYECNIEFEGKLRAKGYYAAYEKHKVINNELSMLKDLKNKVSDSIKFLSEYTPKTKDLQYFNEDGSEEIWVDNTTRRQEMITELSDDLVKINDKIALAVSELCNVEYNPEIEESIKEITIAYIKEKGLNV